MAGERHRAKPPAQMRFEERAAHRETKDTHPESARVNAARTLSESGWNRLAVQLEERSESRAKRLRRQPDKIPARVLRSRAKLILGSAAAVFLVLIITALLAMPHQNAEPAEVAAEPESDAAALMETAFQQPEDWRLVLVNSDVPLPEDYVMTPALYDNVTVNVKIYEELTAMMDAAYDADVNLWIASGYRSVEEQENILESAVESRVANGMQREKAYEDARLTIQQPGYSEHHTGLAVDFNNVAADFRETEAYTWLQAHAAEYGFVERYPKEKESITGIDYEPWHYRYVGKEHAARMKALNMCLEEYVAYVMGGE